MVRGACLEKGQEPPKLCGSRGMSGKGAGKPAMTSGDESDSVEEVDYTTVLRRLVPRPFKIIHDVPN